MLRALIDLIARIARLFVSRNPLVRLARFVWGLVLWVFRTLTGRRFVPVGAVR